MPESLSSELDMAQETSASQAGQQVGPVTLRPARPGDQPFLYELYCSTRADEIAAFGWDKAQQDAFLRLQFRGLQQHYQEQQLEVDSRIIMKAEQPIGQIIVMRSDREIRLADIALL